ncbi:unnamed protein product [Porites evermanni]|uniref:Uncharacterized protein n=1 Tax=Porites evermanni TaxID=104178 RepID=A0ABN8PYD2_9CNID|nr:unnamed protein product [Porites evermanni]
MNTAVRRNASVMTRNFCISAQGGPVLDQESSWNFNQVTNQTENINMETGVQAWEHQATTSLWNTVQIRHLPVRTVAAPLLAKFLAKLQARF